ncbi:MAG: hypothetical protein IIX70_04820, partial [Oscillospiraceae bacterium]|nr:hypothetical protein [Oscillospiraceae bacterium]
FPEGVLQAGKILFFHGLHLIVLAEGKYCQHTLQHKPQADAPEDDIWIFAVTAAANMPATVWALSV